MYLAFLWQPLLRDVRKLPAFKVFVHDLGLVEYWRADGWSDLSSREPGGFRVRVMSMTLPLRTWCKLRSITWRMPSLHPAFN